MKNASFLWNRSVTLYIVIQHYLIVLCTCFGNKNTSNNVIPMHTLKQCFTVILFQKTSNINIYIIDLLELTEILWNLLVEFEVQKHIHKTANLQQ